MKVLTWNIQSTKGCDEKYDPQRIIDVIESFGEVDVICLQEVARNVPVYGGADQRQVFEDHFTTHEGVWGAGFSTRREDGRRSEFGNLTLVRSPLLLDSRTHFLPWPAGDHPRIPRVAVETTVRLGEIPVTVLNSHLAFHNSNERRDQMLALTDIREQILPHSPSADNADQIGAYEQPPVSQQVLLCGDLNIALESDEYEQLVGENGWADCWGIQAELNSDDDRTATCGIYDHVLWPQGAHIRDYFLISRERLSTDADANVSRITVNTDTDASDHQPLLLEWLD